jgi:hypothetical protein
VRHHVIPYPPEPWHLHGQVHLSVWLLPAAEAPTVDVPHVRVLRLFGRAVVATAWAVYEPGSVLRYRELMVTVLTRDRWRVRPSVTAIWVDSPASRDGGRELWGVPKELAEFDVADRSVVMTAREHRVAATTTLGRSVGRWPIRMYIVQRLHGDVKSTPVRARALVRRSRTRWDGLFGGRRPVFGVSLTDCTIRCGATADRTDP